KRFSWPSAHRLWVRSVLYTRQPRAIPGAVGPARRKMRSYNLPGFRGETLGPTQLSEVIVKHASSSQSPGQHSQSPSQSQSQRESKVGARSRSVEVAHLVNGEVISVRRLSPRGEWRAAFATGELVAA